MDWTVIATGVAIVGLVYTMLRNFMRDIKAEMQEVRSELKSEMADINDDVRSIDLNLRSIDQRLSKLEGCFVERGQWEGRLYAMSKNTSDKNAQTQAP